MLPDTTCKAPPTFFSPKRALEGKKQKKGKKKRRSSTYYWKAAFKSLNE
jgi:hypothetical protein